MTDSWIQIEICETTRRVNGITADDNGTIYFTNDSKYVYSVNGNEIGSLPTIILEYSGSLQGLVFDKRNNTLYICEETLKRILSYSIDTKQVVPLFFLQQDDSFHIPYGICMDKNGDFLITDCHRVRKLNINKQQLTTVAGSRTRGHKDGPIAEASFSQPIATVYENIIYVADWLNDAIRKIEDGVVSTIECTDATTIFLAQMRKYRFHTPKAILVDWQGNLLVGDKEGLKKVNLKTQMVSPVRGVTLKSVHSMCQLDWNTIYVGVHGAIYKLVNTWTWKRWIWIGHLKEDSKECLLAILPKDIIKEICFLLDSVSNEA